MIAITPPMQEVRGLIEQLNLLQIIQSLFIPFIDKLKMVVFDFDKNVNELTFFKRIYEIYSLNNFLSYFFIDFFDILFSLWASMSTELIFPLQVVIRSKVDFSSFSLQTCGTVQEFDLLAAPRSNYKSSFRLVIKTFDVTASTANRDWIGSGFYS